MWMIFESLIFTFSEIFTSNWESLKNLLEEEIRVPKNSEYEI